MEQKQGLEHTLQEHVDRMRQERRLDGTLHIDPNPVENAELLDSTAPDFGKATGGGSS